MADYAHVPIGATLEVQPFQARVSDDKLDRFKKLLELSPVAPPVFENTNAGRKYGITRDWLENAKSVWLNDFDWRKHEHRINSYPNYKATVKDGAGNDIELQFLALFSKRADAIPIAFFHGWPGSICHFLDILDILKAKYTPEDLPYHVIVPSIPGYAYSSGPPVDVDYDLEMATEALHNLMLGLGFGSGYLAQGGDLGSFISRILALKYDACKGMHVSMMGMPPPGSPEKEPTPDEQRALDRAAEVVDTGYGFVMIQGTRPATIGHVLSSSPLALLAWMAEKYLEWSDADPPLDKILEAVTLYWLTDTMPRALWHNRGLGNPEEKPKMARMSLASKLTALQLPRVEKPCGYSLFAGEIVPAPRSWAEASCNLVHFAEHGSGGHFAAVEKPRELLEDVEGYIQTAWKTS